MNRIYLYLSALLLLLLTTACEHKKLCYHHPHTSLLEVKYDWKKAPEAKPTSMLLFLFPEEGGDPLRYDLPGREGGEISVPAGRYNAIAFNGDTEAIFYEEGESQKKFDTFQITAREQKSRAEASSTDPRSQDTRGQRSILAPDKLWWTSMTNIQVQPLVEGQKQVITLYPEPKVYEYIIEIRNVKNMKYVKGVKGMLSGMARGFLGATGELLPPPVVLEYEPEMKEDYTVLIGGFYTFGRSAQVSKKHELAIAALLVDGSAWGYNLDVTQQVEQAVQTAIQEGHPFRVHIIIDGLPFPTPIDNGTGFHADVDDWQDVYVDLDM